MFNIGIPELILILVLALIVFGPKKLPEIGRSVGNGLREFKKAVGDIQKTIQTDIKEANVKEKDVAPADEQA